MDKVISFAKTDFESDYDAHEILGKGRFGIVKKCVEKATGSIFAAKFIDKRARRKGFSMEQAKLEVDILKLCSSLPSSTFSISLHDVYETRSQLILVLEYVNGRELFDWIAANGALGEARAKYVIQQLLQSVHGIHTQGIVHRDIKPENVLISTGHDCICSNTRWTAPEKSAASSPFISPCKSSSSSPAACSIPSRDCVCAGWRIKLADFGMARYVSSAAKEIACTPSYASPEIVAYEPAGCMSDMWSIGVVTYVLITGRAPFDGNTEHETFANITKGYLEFPLELFARVSENAVRFMKALLQRNPKRRLTAAAALEHPWMTEPVVPLTMTQIAAGLPLPESPAKSLLQLALEEAVEKALPMSAPASPTALPPLHSPRSVPLPFSPLVSSPSGSFPSSPLLMHSPSAAHSPRARVPFSPVSANSSPLRLAVSQSAKRRTSILNESAIPSPVSCKLIGSAAEDAVAEAADPHASL